MSVTVINEKIETGVVFAAQKANPKWFIWNKRRIEVEQVTFTWRSVEGSAALIHFAVKGKGGYYELSYNTKNLEWMLEKTEEE